MSSAQVSPMRMVALFSPCDPARDAEAIQGALPGHLAFDMNAPLAPALIEQLHSDFERVVIWNPTNEIAGRAADNLARKLHDQGLLDIRTIMVGTWDASETLVNAIRRGVPNEKLSSVLMHAQQWEPKAPRKKREPPRNLTADGQDAVMSMAQMGLAVNKNGDVWNNATNVAMALSKLAEFSGDAIWFDQFRYRVMTTWKCNGICPREWSDEDDAVLLGWMQSRLGWHNLTDKSLRQGFMIFLQSRARHPLREYLNGLAWDQTERLPTLLTELYGTPDDEYHQAVGRCWIISMIARAMDPGCKVDTMPVIEGGQGLKKSTSLEILGGEFYAALPRDFGSVDFVQCMDGAWLAEIPDMSGFRGRDLEQVKAFITIRHDRIRRSYGRRAGTWPRQSVFVATANPNDWNDDDTGARRFWPIAAKTVNVEWLRANRDQIFAEAMVRYGRGEPWWDVPRETAAEHQEERRIVDPWQEIISEWTSWRTAVYTKDVFTDALGMSARDIDKRSERRVGGILRMIGFKRSTERAGERVIRVWRREDRLQPAKTDAVQQEESIEF